MSKVENKELKVKSFRVDETIFAKFKEIASSEFGNQSQCLDALINLYEIEESKSILVGRELEIESFQDYLNKLSRLFVASLQMSSDAELRVKEGFLKQLEAKDEALVVLKNEIRNLKENIASSQLVYKNMKNQYNDIVIKNKELDENKSTLVQLANRNYDLAENMGKEVKTLKKELENYNIIKDESSKKQEELFRLQNINKELNLELDKKNNEIKSLNKELDIQIINLTEKNKEILSYKTLVDTIQKEQKANIIAVENKLKNEYEVKFAEKMELTRKTNELDKRELELKIKELELFKK